MTEDLPIVKSIRMVKKCDIVEWLRSHEDNDLVDMDGMNEAADEIERLREALHEIKFRINNMPKDMQLTPNSPIFELINVQIQIALEGK